jgi:hypothetical protein
MVYLVPTLTKARIAALRCLRARSRRCAILLCYAFPRVRIRVIAAAASESSSRTPYGPSYVDPIESLPLLGQILDCPAAAQMQMAMGHRDTGRSQVSRLERAGGTANRRAPRPLET